MAATQFSRRVLARAIAAKLAEEPARQKYWMRALAAYLVEQKRSHEAELIITDIERELQVQTGQLMTRVTSARPLTETARKELAGLLEIQTGAKKVIISQQTNPDIIGGLVVRTPDGELDASVRTKLKRLATIN